MRYTLDAAPRVACASTLARPRQVSISPHLEAGDLLLLHMPIIHRTQAIIRAAPRRAALPSIPPVPPP
jgi:hypothetical protein